MKSTAFWAGYYGFRSDASEAFIQGYLDEVQRLDQRGQGVACGRGWIPRTKKCSRDKASQTSDEAKAKTVEKAKARAKLKGEVKAAKGQKARNIGEAEKMERRGQMTRKPKEPPTLKSLMQEYEALFRQYRLENRDDYDIDATVAYRMADIANDVRGFAKAGGDDYAVMQMAEELDYFKELIEREKANR
jgi:hypothetical protein